MKGTTDYISKFDVPNVEKQWVIKAYKNGTCAATITNELLYNSGIQLTESICDEEQLRFGGCIAAEFKFTMAIDAVAFSLVDYEIKAYVKLDGDTGDGLLVGTYFCETDVKDTKNHSRTIDCYDYLAKALNTNVNSWYSSLFPTDSTTKTIKQIRDSLFTHLGITQETVTLPNDSAVIGKTISSVGLSAGAVIKALCELNGVFGKMDNESQFVYTALVDQEVLYPADDLYPDDELYPLGAAIRFMSETYGNGTGYLQGTFGSYDAKKIEAVQIREDSSSAGVTVGSGNTYTIEGNFLCYGMGTTALTSIATNILANVNNFSFTPYEVMCLANLCFDVGDCVIINTKNGIIRSYIMSRTCKGSQFLTEEYTAKGKEDQETETASLSSSLMQLQQKSNVLTRTIEQTQSTLTDTAAGLQTQITQNAGEISSVASNVSGLSSRVSQTASAITAEVTRATGAESTLSGQIALKPDTITLTINNNEKSAGIKIGWKENGVDKEATGTIQFTGDVIFANDLTDGTTEISGDNIKTGTISADRVDVANLKVNRVYDSTGANPVLKSDIHFIELGDSIGTFIKIGKVYEFDGHDVYWEYSDELQAYVLCGREINP